MKLYHISLHDHNQNDKELLQASALSMFSLWHKGKVNEIMRFISTTIVSRCSAEKKTSVDDGDFVVHVQINAAGIAGVVISDKRYPKDVAHRLIDKILKIGNIDSKQLDILLQSYQQPETDPLYKVKKDLEETKDILCQTLEKILERGEKLDDLIAKTDFLSENSKTFLKVARKSNRWCPLWFSWPDLPKLIG